MTPENQSVKNCPACRVCGAAGTVDMGALPDSRRFAGEIHEQALNGGQLHRCLICYSMQRSPIYSEDFYTELYRQSPEGLWTDSDARNDNRMIREVLANHPHVRTALDVGCNTGTLLESLPTVTTRFGIEPSARARQVAETKGIVVLGATLDSIPPDSAYDCVMTVDVVEHLSDPTSFLERLYALLRENGLLIVSTGNPTAWVWRSVFKSDFWYSAPPEHLTFPSPGFMLGWAARHNMNVVSLHEFSYMRTSLLEFGAKVLLQVFYHHSKPLHRVLHKAIYHWQRRHGKASSASAEVASPLPCAGVFRDHYVVVLQKAS